MVHVVRELRNGQPRFPKTAILAPWTSLVDEQTPRSVTACLGGPGTGDRPASEEISRPGREKERNLSDGGFLVEPTACVCCIVLSYRR